jgi:hypothetical protein
MHGSTKALAIALLATSAWAHAAAPDTEAVEFYNTALGHYFVTTSASEALGIDAGAAGPGWVRTGRSFQAWSSKSTAPAAAQAVCRFYSTGANSHFYTASADECLELRGMEAAERAQTGGVKGWSYEGVAFFIEVPQSGQCAAGSTKLVRLYNNGFATGEGANHRFVDDADLETMMVDQQWVPEGVAFCAASKPATGTDADMPPTTTSFGAIAGTWSGSATWKSESASAETRAAHDLSLTISADGIVTGSGDGCTFTGKLASGDGFRAYFRGAATATGCTDAAFNGAYPHLRLQRLGTGTLMARLQREDDDETSAAAVGDEVSIQGNLTNGTATTPPPAPSLAGDWTGPVAWLAVQHMSGGHIFERASAIQTLSLSISAAGAVSGSGFGCTVTGTLAAPTKKGDVGDDDQGEATGSGFSGSITLAGCDQALFDGTYGQAQARFLGSTRLVIDLERDATDATSTIHVEIAGALQAAPAPASP